MAGSGSEILAGSGSFGPSEKFVKLGLFLTLINSRMYILAIDFTISQLYFLILNTLLSQ